MMGKLRRAVRKRLARRLGVPEIPTCMASMADRGFAPALIFDVGAYEGEFVTDALRIWPGAKVACFEPQDGAAAKIVDMCDDRIDLHRCLLGPTQKDAVVLNVCKTASSVLTEWHATHEQQSYHQATIDDVIAGYYAGHAPDFLKLDVQGYELEVLRGATHSLPEVKAILIEINLIDIHRGVPLMHEMVDWLWRFNFVAYDICGLTRRPLDRALWQADMIFVKADSPLRQDKRWQP